MKPRRTPQRVGLRQSLNQPANLALDRRPPNSSRFTGQTSPVPAKTLPLPAHHRVGMGDEQSLPPVLPPHRDSLGDPILAKDRLCKWHAPVQERVAVFLRTDNS